MYYQDYWLKNQIRLMADTVVKILFFDKETERWKIIEECMENNDPNEAEDKLFKWKDEGINCDREALLFYMNLNELSDDELLQMNFSREEVQRGMIDFFDILNPKSMPDEYFEE